MWFRARQVLKAGQRAPAFKLKDSGGKTHRLDDYLGKWLVLYFYPKDDTPGCTKEACHFRDDLEKLQMFDAEVLGISTDNENDHKTFASKFSLNFPLLSDPEGECARAYGALLSLGFFKIAKRHSFIIDPEGRIARIFRKVNADDHSNEVIAELKSLQHS